MSETEIDATNVFGPLSAFIADPTIEEIWIQELDEFSKAYNVYIKELDEIRAKEDKLTNKKDKPVKKAKKTKKD